MYVTQPPAAAAALMSALRRLDNADSRIDRSSLAIALALLAGGRFERVRTILTSGLCDRAALPLLTARYVAWTGDLATAASVWDRVVAEIELQLATTTDDSEETLLLLASSVELERTATDLGNPALAARLVAAARRIRTQLDTRVLTEPARRFAAVTGLGMRPGFADVHEDRDVANDPLVVLGFVHGVLAIEPDATRGRIRLQPRLRAEWSQLHAPIIRFGDGAISLTIERTTDRTSFDVGQESGAIPFTVVLEPIVNGAVGITEVDGRAASLAPRALEAGTLVPVQLVLDDERSLVIHVTFT